MMPPEGYEKFISVLKTQQAYDSSYKEGDNDAIVPQSIILEEGLLLEDSKVNIRIKAYPEDDEDAWFVSAPPFSLEAEIPPQSYPDMDTDDYEVEELDDDYDSRMLYVDCSDNEATNIQVTGMQLI
eukprot:CAMPEP_0170509726 /NCGR_PEP_ID=MMETSP0208-20121228/65372_1 /TAXON_ID=197538 /ORGANISM="Strombidium inclinatum, Strain S3" /LENGTH=125 /DNA_ID=CAMNT_0010793111 /DNA_START=1619 /DNA_END=1995 /DNA_ORIENTATION=-